MSEQRVVLVTGGGTGIGAATARLLRSEGHQVVISGRRPEPLRRVAEETGALAHPSDAGDPEAVRELVETAVTAYGRLDGLVLNAGIGRGGAVGDTEVEDWDALTAIGRALTVLMVTHDITEAFRLGTRVLAFDKRRHDPHAPHRFGATAVYDLPLTRKQKLEPPPELLRLTESVITETGQTL